MQPVRTWQVQDAKARFSEMLDACITSGPQWVTRRGVQAAVLVPVHEWQRLQTAARPSLKALLMQETTRCDLPIPERGQARRRVAIDMQEGDTDHVPA